MQQRHTYQIQKNGKYFKLVWKDEKNNRSSVSLGRCSRQSAQQKMEATIKRHMREDESITPTNMSLEHWLCRYIEVKKHDLAASTLKGHKQTCSLLREWFSADAMLTDITKANGTDWRVWLKAHKDMSESTACKQSRQAKAIFNAAINEDHLVVNPFGHLAVSEPAKGETEKGWVSEEDVRSVGYARPEIRDLVVLCFFTGLRIGEALALAPDDYRPLEGKLYVRKGKGGRDRTCRLEPHLVASVPTLERMPAKNTHGYIHRILKSGCEIAGVKPFTFHDLRSTRDTIWHKHFPAHVACSWMGHSESVARKHYLSVQEDHYTPTHLDILA